MKKNNGFTLIELLAVIVILGLIAIISFPKIIEMVQKQNEKIDTAKLNLIYTASKTYLYDNQNKYPPRAGNNFCIKPKELEQQGYIKFDIDDLDTNYLVKVSYFDDSTDMQMSYVKSSDCSADGIINTEMAGLTCLVDKAGYSISKKVTITYPINDQFSYLYSLDDGKTWKEIQKFDSESSVYFNFSTAGSVLAKVKEQGTSNQLSCSVYVDQIDLAPIGTVIAYAGSTIPSGYLLADGSLVSRVQYYDLYATIKDTYGRSSSTKTFQLPNLKGRLIVGENPSDTSFTFGNYGGEKTHSITLNELPSHTHTFTGTANNTTASSGAHTHTFSGTTDTSVTHTHSGLYSNSVDQTNQISLTSGIIGYKATATGNSSTTTGAGSGGLLITGSSGAHTHTFSETTASSVVHNHTATATGKNANTGGSGQHQNLMPYYTINYIIKYQ